MVRIARELGYDLKGMTTPITREKLHEADCIVIFDAEHRNAISRVLDYANWDRIIMFDKQAFGTDTAVMDPHYQTDAVYQSVASHIVEGCKRMIEQWRDNPTDSPGVNIAGQKIFQSLSSDYDGYHTMMKGIFFSQTKE